MVGKRYRILETLGKGAFGTVYRAEVLGAGDFKKQVALKVLDYKGEAPDEIALRFRDEARILGLIRHRAVVGVDSLAELETGWAVVMEYVHGVNVSAVVKYGLPPARVVVSVVEEVASALHAAWTTVSETTGEPLRLVHRDIKPANIRVTAQGEVKVLDFGVARAEFASREATTQAMRFGSLRYMAPESFDGIEGHPTDIFALGIVFGELLSGQRLDEPPKNPERYQAFVDKVIEAARERLVGQVTGEQLGRITALVSEMIAFEPEDRPSARAVERVCRELAAVLPGPPLRDWAEEYVPALAEKLARRAAQKETTDAPSSEILVEKSAGAVVEGSMPPSANYIPQDATETRARSTAALASGAMFGAGVTLIGLAVVVLTVIGLGIYFLGPARVDDRSDGVASLDGDPDAVEVRATGDGSDLQALEGLPATEYFEVVDPQDPNRTIVIARGDVRAAGTDKESISFVDPLDSTRTIVIAKRAVGGRTVPPAPAPAEVVIPVPAPPTPVPAPAPAPGPTVVQITKVEPAPAPAPAPTLSAQPLASGGGVTVTGDVKSVAFVSDAGRFGPGNVPVGTYRILAIFGDDGKEVQAGTVTVRDGEAVRVECNPLMVKCSRK